MAAILVSAKVSIFYSKIAKTSPKSSQRFYLAQTLTKTKNFCSQSSNFENSLEHDFDMNVLHKIDIQIVYIFLIF